MGIFDMAGMLGNVKEMQAKMQEAQEKLSELTAEGEAGGGMVKVVANGKKSLVSVNIEPELLNKEEIDILQDLIVAAANKALENAEELAKEEMQNATKGMLPNIPGMDLDSLFKK
ncbi:YbaB/EbfC family nucleoid-associated protein [Marinilongibacter aquaticus]|uniref:YbaB/EbfC family nucleoid-associated protein n=1 Tax=Marinilongibacter aquaticus TaxID=2975157 RepID=UPI0021BD3E3B|nr:YbaB/EbfC family nucleoid-associated protein [Marinilongibacter aquaticus]UBM60458.1 YbaB/EbfC family nucleoid-associated protein [Marinilongibacter aquaticus]